MAHCQTCPLRDGRCFGEVQPTLCGLAGTTAGDRHVVLRSAVADGWEPPTPGYVEPAVEPDSPPPPPPAPPIPLSDSLRARRVGFKHCPESSPASCSCPASVRCRLAGRDVAFFECVECVTVGPRKGVEA